MPKNSIEAMFKRYPNSVTILGNHPSHLDSPTRAVVSWMIALTLLIGTCAVFYFDSEDLFNPYASELQESTLIFSGIQLVPLLLSMAEYTWIFHNARALTDKYKWWLCPLITCFIELIFTLIYCGFLEDYWWVAIVHFLTSSVAIFTPRLVPLLHPEH